MAISYFVFDTGAYDHGASVRPQDPGEVDEGIFRHGVSAGFGTGQLLRSGILLRRQFFRFRSEIDNCFDFSTFDILKFQRYLVLSDDYLLRHGFLVQIVVTVPDSCYFQNGRTRFAILRYKTLFYKILTFTDVIETDCNTFCFKKSNLHGFISTKEFFRITTS